MAEFEYVFKSLKFYTSNEWMANISKKYRVVFDEAEIKQFGVELALYNTKFQEESWYADVEFVCFQVEGENKNELYKETIRHEVLNNDNETMVYLNWKPGNTLQKGTYKWEVYINNNYVNEANFYIEEAGMVSRFENPYFDLKSIKLYHGTKDGVDLEKREYLVQFDRDKTQYVWVQLEVINKLNTDWFCEVFYNFHDETGLLKESVTSFNYFEKNYANERFLLTAGWGSQKPGYWLEDIYYINIVFMDKLIARVPLKFGNEEIVGEVYDMLDKNQIEEENIAKGISDADIPKDESLESVIADLNNLIGLEEIKQTINDYVKYVQFVKIRKEKGIEEDEDFVLHSVFMGNPGTGKTTVVKLLGRIFKHIGLLSKGHVHEVDRSDIVGEYIGQTAPMTKRAIEKARGGILFVDEAYMLARDSERDFGKEAIEVLLKEMSDGPGDIAIMVAGYPNEMNKFLNTNPGLRSRFKYHYMFKDYTPDELFDIAMFAADKRAIRLTDKAQVELKKILTSAYRNRDTNFGNARFATYLIDKAKIQMGIRLIQYPDVERFNDEILSTVTPEDILKLAVKKEETIPEIPVNKELLTEGLQELNDLVGLHEVKEEINELVKLVKYYREMKYDVMNEFSLHTVFKGNPGTGKTTVARIVAKIYKALGLIERGHLVETDREGLVAGYIGQTAIKTKEKINKAMGGILFIDEAYGLNDHSNHGFGGEAVEVILKNMEDKRGKFGVIVAGYPDNMNEFLASNPGLKSRFDRVLNFNDYSEEELLKIALSLFTREKVYPDKKAVDYLKNYMQYLVKTRDKYFGNAREIKKLVTESIRNLHLRMADLPKEKRTKKAMETITLDDVDDFVIKPVVKRPSIGFKSQHLR